jgi:hypothetical protein
MPVDTINGVKRAAERQRISQADYIDAAVRPALIAAGIIKQEKRNETTGPQQTRKGRGEIAGPGENARGRSFRRAGYC